MKPEWAQKKSGLWHNPFPIARALATNVQRESGIDNIPLSRDFSQLSSVFCCQTAFFQREV
jgi:hypothetical protein